MAQKQLELPRLSCCEKADGIEWGSSDDPPGMHTWCIVTGADIDGVLEYSTIQFCPYCGQNLPDSTTACGLFRIFSQYQLRFDTERHLQEDVRDVLKFCGIQFVRERQLPGGPIDFLTRAGVGIECKVDGSPSEVLRQLLRYAEQGEVKQMLLLTSKASHRWREELELLDKPFEILWVGANSL